jgi:uncharacterized Zn-finger protein
MWKCGKCGEQNEDQFTSCWRCHDDAPGIDPEETQLDILVDPERPQPISDAGAVQCPTCGQQFKVDLRKQESSAVRRRSDHALCPHCGHTVTPELLVKVSPAKRDVGEAVKEVIYACPYCGKVLTVVQQ